MKTFYTTDNEIRNLLLGIKDSITKLEEDGYKSSILHQTWLIENMRIFLKLVEADGETYPPFIGEDVLCR